MEPRAGSGGAGCGLRCSAFFSSTMNWTVMPLARTKATYVDGQACLSWEMGLVEACSISEQVEVMDEASPRGPEWRVGILLSPITATTENGHSNYHHPR